MMQGTALISSYPAFQIFFTLIAEKLLQGSIQ